MKASRVSRMFRVPLRSGRPSSAPTVSSAALTLPRRSVASGSSIQDRSTSMNPPTRNRLTDSGVRLARWRRPACPGPRSARTRARVRRGRRRRRAGVTALGTMLRYIARCSAAKSNSARMRAPGSPAISRGGRSERDGECVRDRVVAVAEVLIEHLATDPGARDDVADRQLVDRDARAPARTLRRAAGRGPVRHGDRHCGCVLPYPQRKARS